MPASGLARWARRTPSSSRASSASKHAVASGPLDGAHADRIATGSISALRSRAAATKPASSTRRNSPATSRPAADRGEQRLALEVVAASKSCSVVVTGDSALVSCATRANAIRFTAGPRPSR